MSGTNIYEAKQRTKKQNEEMRKAAEAKKALRFERLLTTAMNHPAIKSSFFNDKVITGGRVDLSIEEQLDLLESYVRVLKRSYKEFIADFPDKHAQAAAKPFLELRKDALEHIANLRVGLTRGIAEAESGLIRPSPESLARIEREKHKKEIEERQRVKEARRG